MTGLSIVELILTFVLVPLATGTAYVVIDEGMRNRRDARWLSRRS